MAHDHSTAVHQLLELGDWIDRLAPGLWAPPAAIQACLPWWRSYLRELIAAGRVEERQRELPGGRILRMASVHDALAAVERSAAAAERQRMKAAALAASARAADRGGG